MDKISPDKAEARRLLIGKTEKKKPCAQKRSQTELLEGRLYKYLSTNENDF
jgi:hypothetical protein